MDVTQRLENGITADENAFLRALAQELQLENAQLLDELQRLEARLGQPK